MVLGEDDGGISDSRHVAPDPAAVAALPRDAPERRALEVHARGCPECARALRQGERVLDLLDESLAVPPASSETLQTVKASIHRRLAIQVAAPAAAGSIAMAVLLVALAPAKLDASRALGAVALATIGTALCWLAARGHARAALVVASNASALFALVFASVDAIAPVAASRAVAIELIPAAAGLATVLLWNRSRESLKSDHLRTIAVLATCLLIGQAALIVAYPVSGGPLHAVIVQSGAPFSLWALAALSAWTDRRDEAAAPSPILQLRSPTPWKRAIGGAVAATAIAAALLVIPKPADEERLKGGAVGLLVHRKRGEQVRVLDSSDRIRAGDALRVSLSVAGPTRAAIWFVDARGRIDPFLPAGPVVLRAGEQTIGGSVIVENPCLDLWVVVATGSAADRAGEALAHALPASPAAGDDWLPRGAVARRLRCE